MRSVVEAASRECPERWAALLTLGILSSFALLFAQFAHGAEIIPADRRIDWSNAGIPGGVPSRTTIFRTIDAAAYGNGTTDATAVLQDAVNSCPNNQVVYVPAGTYVVSATVSLRSNKTLRGAGAGQTILTYPGASVRSILDMRGSIYNDITNLQRSFAITGGMTKGSTQITLSGASGISVGDILLIDQLNDGQLVDAEGIEGYCNYAGRAGGTRARGQFAEVAAIAGSTFTLTIPLFWSLSGALSPEATLVNAGSMVRNAGIEDLTLTASQASVEFMVEMDGAQYCWLKGIEITRLNRRAVWMISSLQNEIRESRFHDAIGGFGRDRGYGVLADSYATANLIENNIFHTIDGGGMMAAGGASGNVFGYNYIFDGRFDDPAWHVAYPSLNHAPHPSMNLWEGNIGSQMGADCIHGSSSHNTVFRCRSTGWLNDAAVNNNNAIELQFKNTYYNVLGCVFGTPGKSANYQMAYPDATGSQIVNIWRLGYGGPDWAGDPNVLATLLRHGNFDYVNNATLWDPAIADHDLPASLYKSSKPSWWGDLPWPAIGPDLTPMTSVIPAQARYESMIGNASPVIESRLPAADPVTVEADTVQIFSVYCSDPDGDALEYAWTIDSSTAGSNDPDLSYTPVLADVGGHTIRIAVSDGRGGTASNDWAVTVSSAVVPPPPPPPPPPPDDDGGGSTPNTTSDGDEGISCAALGVSTGPSAWLMVCAVLVGWSKRRKG